MRRPFLAWPGWAHLRWAGLLFVQVTVWFGLVYGGADWFTAQRTARVRVNLEAELSIPLIPSFTVVYMSIYPLFLAAPYVLRTRRDLTTLAIDLSLAILFAGIVFLLVPAQLAFAPSQNLGPWEGLFRFADRLNLDYNLVPSLHVASSVNLHRDVRASRDDGWPSDASGLGLAHCRFNGLHPSAPFAGCHHRLWTGAGAGVAKLSRDRKSVV